MSKTLRNKPLSFGMIYVCVLRRVEIRALVSMIVCLFARLFQRSTDCSPSGHELTLFLLLFVHSVRVCVCAQECVSVLAHVLRKGRGGLEVIHCCQGICFNDMRGSFACHSQRQGGILIVWGFGWRQSGAEKAGWGQEVKPGYTHTHNAKKEGKEDTWNWNCLWLYPRPQVCITAGD